MSHLALAGCVALFTASAIAQPHRAVNRIEKPSPALQTEISVLPVQGNIYLLSGAESNVTLQLGSQGVLLVDTGSQASGDKLVTEIKRLAGDKVIRYVIDSQLSLDHVGGNEIVRKAGASVMGGNVVMDDPRGQQGATVIAHENVEMRMAEPTSRPAAARGLWPTETFSGASYNLFFNDEAVLLIHAPKAHTDGDVMVFFRRSDVLATGDIFTTTTYPVVDIAHGGSIDGLIDALNLIIDITIPRDKQEGGTIVVPGHGRLCDEADVVEYRDMVTIIRDRIRAMVDNGMTLEQVNAAKPTLDYDGRYGVDSDLQTRQKFVESVYQSLKLNH